MRAPVAVAILSALTVTSPPLQAAVLMNARLEANRIPVGGTTILHVEASYLDAVPASPAQLASWVLSIQSAQPRVANGRFRTMEKPNADGGPEASAGLATEAGRAGIGDSCRRFPGAGVGAPFALIRLLITGYARGQTQFTFDGAAGPLSVTVLNETGHEWSVPVRPPGSLQLEVVEENEITIPSTVRRVPNYVRAGQNIRLQFPLEEGTDNYIEYADRPEGPWSAVPEGPLRTGDFFDRPVMDAGFYRLRRQGSSLVPPHLTATIEPIFRVQGSLAEINFDPLSGWTHFVESRGAETEPWSHRLGISVTPPPAIIPESQQEQTYRVRAQTSFDRDAFDGFLIAGQSNAAWLDYDFPEVVPGAWKLDAHTGFVPLRRPAEAPDFLFVDAFPSGAAAALTREPAHPVLLIPCAVGGTTLAQWVPGSNRLDPATLFGRAQFRRLAAAPAGLRAIWYYGHEASMTDPDALTNYASDWASLMESFREECGPVPVIYAQVGRHTDDAKNALLQRGAEQQRLAESGRVKGLRAHHMVVALDLPLFDAIHLTPAAHRILGERFALATRQHVYGEAVNGTGPRLLSVTHPGQDRSRLEVRFDRPINEAIDAYDHLFRAFTEEQEVAIKMVQRGADTQTVQIELATVPSGLVTLSYGDRPAGPDHAGLRHVIRDADGLPTPRFGPLVCPTAD